MPSARTRDEIIVKARQLADQEDGGTGPSFVDAEEARDRVNDALADFWELLIAHGRGEEVATIMEVTPASAVAPDFPDDFLQLLRLDVQVGSRWQEIDRLNSGEVNDWQGSTGEPRRYELLNVHTTTITPLLYPTPSGIFTYRIRYVPEAPQFTNDIAEPGVTSITLPNRWWRWVEYTTAIGLAIKEESDAASLAAERARMEARILDTRSSVNRQSAARVRDTRGRVADLRERRDRATFGWGRR